MTKLAFYKKEWEEFESIEKFGGSFYLLTNCPPDPDGNTNRLYLGEKRIDNGDGGSSGFRNYDDIDAGTELFVDLFVINGNNIYRVNTTFSKTYWDNDKTYLTCISGEKGDKGDIGVKGDKGDAATIAIGTVTELPTGYHPTVANSGDNHNAIFDFELPKGVKGDTGADGKSFSISAQYETEADLLAAHPTGQTGDAYFVGLPSDVSRPDVYIWLDETNTWFNQGPIAGVKGDTGDSGVYIGTTAPTNPSVLVWIDTSAT